MSQADKDSVSAVTRLLRAHDSEGLARLLGAMGPDDRAWLLAHVDEATRREVLSDLTPEDAAELIHEVSDEQGADLIELLSPQQAAQIVEQLDSDERADLLSMMPPEGAASVLAELAPEEAADTRRLLSYPGDTAGGLMVTELLRFAHDATIAQVLDSLRAGAHEYSDYEVQYAYVTDSDDRLLGVLRIRDLLFARPEQRVDAAMIGNPQHVVDTNTLAELREFFDEHAYVGAPVTDADGKLLGVVRRFAVQEALREQMSSLYRRLSGVVGGDELRSMPLGQRSLRRLSWLSANIVLNVLAASIIAAHQDTLAAAIVLAVFLPMISDMSGCSGNQAVAVSLRELTLGVVRPSEIARVLRQELAVGLINGVVLGAMLGALAGVWKHNLWLGLVVGGALAINTVLAVALGGAIPLILRRFRLDPALASGPLLTTVTDMCGFFLVLTLAEQVLSRL